MTYEHNLAYEARSLGSYTNYRDKIEVATVLWICHDNIKN